MVGVKKNGIWIRGDAETKVTHAHCPASELPAFECKTPGVVGIWPRDIATLERAVSHTDPDTVTVALNDDQLTIEANGFGGTVPSMPQVAESPRYHRIADYDLPSFHESHTAEADVADWRFEAFLDSSCRGSDATLTMTTTGVTIKSERTEEHWEWSDCTGTGETTYRVAEVHEVYERCCPSTTPMFSWADDEPLAMVAESDGWTVGCYVISKK